MEGAPGTLVFKIFWGMLYLLCCQATLHTIVSTCKLCVVTTNKGAGHKGIDSTHKGKVHNIIVPTCKLHVVTTNKGIEHKRIVHNGTQKLYIVLKICKNAGHCNGPRTTSPITSRSRLMTQGGCIWQHNTFCNTHEV